MSLKLHRSSIAQSNPDRHWVLAGPAELFWIWWRDLVPSIAAPTFATMGFGVPKISRTNSMTRSPVMGSTSRCIRFASTKKARILPGSVKCQVQGLQTGGRQPRRQDIFAVIVLTGEGEAHGEPVAANCTPAMGSALRGRQAAVLLRRVAGHDLRALEPLPPKTRISHERDQRSGDRTNN